MSDVTDKQELKLRRTAYLRCIQPEIQGTVTYETHMAIGELFFGALPCTNGTAKPCALAAWLSTSLVIEHMNGFPNRQKVSAAQNGNIELRSAKGQHVNNGNLRKVRPALCARPTSLEPGTLTAAHALPDSR